MALSARRRNQPGRVPQHASATIGFGSLFRPQHHLCTPTPRPCCPAVLEGTVQPGKFSDRTVDLDGVPDGYGAMAARQALTVLVRP